MRRHRCVAKRLLALGNWYLAKPKSKSQKRGIGECCLLRAQPRAAAVHEKVESRARSARATKGESQRLIAKMLIAAVGVAGSA